VKIAFIVSKFPSLSETFILNQLVGLLDRGYEVDIYADSPSRDPINHTDIERYNLLGRTFYYGEAVRQLMPANKVWRLIKAVGLAISGFPQKLIPLIKSLNVFRFGMRAASLSLYYQSVVLLDKALDNYDVVHCHFGPNGDFGALLKDIGVVRGKVVTTFYGYDVSKQVKNGGNNVYPHLFKGGDLFLPISNRMKKQLVELGCDEQRIAVHRLGVDTSRFSFYARQLREDGQIHLLTISRLVEKKGVEHSIRAVAQVLRDYPQIEYKIAGDGPLKSKLQSLIDTLKLNGRVKLLGWRRQDEIIQLVKEANVLLTPSVTSADGDEEGTPVALMEALAQGLPVLTTQHSGIPEIVEDGKSGYLVPERDVDALTNKLRRLIEHPEIWVEMGLAGRAHVERYYDINKLNDELINLYERLAKGEDYISQPESPLAVSISEY
jgi:colanic acid/amylovoran biosynthesis glycosyltransferase